MSWTGTGDGAVTRAEPPADADRPRPRRRDRHGRGPRGPLLPATLPGHRTRGERFDDLVLDTLERVGRRWRPRVEEIEIAVEDVPPADPSPWEGPDVPLGRYFPAERGLPPRVVVYRRPVETRGADDADLAELVRQVVVEQLAHALGVDPDDLDPHGDG